MTILEAIEAKDLDRVKEILAHDPTCIDNVNDDGLSMSFIAAKIGDFDIVKYIVEYSRASMNTVDDKNRTILHFCAMSGNVEMAKYLVEKVGMSVTKGDQELITPYDIAHDNGHKELEDYFEKICGAPLSSMYRNPIRSGMFPDPSVLRVGEDYYMVNSSFVFFPCIPISHSKDLLHWKIIGHAITNPDWAKLDDLEGGRGYWAPDISYYDGRYYITATYRLNDTGTIYRKQIIVSSKNPQGPYTEPIFIHEDGIDPSLFTDDDGKRYMLLNRGARILELNKEATKQISEAKLLYYGDQKRAPEGPHLLKKEGFYYLFLAEGGTGPGHRITVARSKSLFGNYEPCPYNPIMRQTDEKGALSRCGHGKPIMTQKGDWYMVYLCGRSIGEGYSLLGRETALDPIQWTPDGWPLVNNLKGPGAIQKKPDLLELIWENQDYDGFDRDKLGLEWMFPRPPEVDGYSILDSQLLITGSKEPMDKKEARNILLRRQKHFCFSVVTKMGVVGILPMQDAGMTCYYDENTWLKFGLFSTKSGSIELKVMEHIGEIDRVSNKFLVIPSIIDSIFLKIKTQYLRREFYYSFDGQEYCLFEVLDNVYYLSDEGINMGKRFTGAMIGMYAYSGEKELIVPFEFFEYSPLS